MKVTLSNNSPMISYYGDNRILLHNDVRVTTDTGISFSVLKGFGCDGSSVPRIFWGIVGSPTTGPNMLAGIIHDYLYRYQVLPRKDCDKVFFKVLLELKKPRWQAWLMYRAVRIFAGSFYKM